MDHEQPHEENEIGWRERLRKSLRDFDYRLIKSLPRPIAKAFIVAKLSLGWSPDFSSLPDVDPLQAYNDHLMTLGTMFLEDVGADRYPHINTVVMPSVGDPVKVHSPNYKEGQREVPFNWTSQIAWAADINARHAAGEVLDSEDLKEAVTIAAIQDGATEMYRILAPNFEQQGLPVPPGVTLPETHA